MSRLAEALMAVLEEILERPELFGGDAQLIFDRLYLVLENEVGASPELHLMRVQA